MARKDVNPHFEKWTHLKPNQYCTLRINPWGTHEWRNPQGLRHRVDENGIQDGPAVIWANGSLEWRLNGLLHRVDLRDGHEGAAVFRSGDLAKAWWVNGENVGSYAAWVNHPQVILHQTLHGDTNAAEEWLTRL